MRPSQRQIFIQFVLSRIRNTNTFSSLWKEKTQKSVVGYWSPLFVRKVPLLSASNIVFMTVQLFMRAAAENSTSPPHYWLVSACVQHQLQPNSSPFSSTSRSRRTSFPHSSFFFYWIVFQPLVCICSSFSSIFQFIRSLISQYSKAEGAEWATLHQKFQKYHCFFMQE